MKRNETGKGSTHSCVRVRAALVFLDDHFHAHIAHAQLPSTLTSIMSLSKFSRLSGSSSDDSDLEQLLSQVKRKRARRRLFRATALMKDDDVGLLSSTTKVSYSIAFMNKFMY